MDNMALQFGNLIVGNPISEAGLEIAGGYFEAEFQSDAVMSLCGTDMKPTINGNAIPMWEAVAVKEGDVLSLGVFGEFGFRSYLAVAGGFDVPPYLGSKSTCIFGNYGGFEGRALRPDDMLTFGVPAKSLAALAGRKLRKEVIPEYSRVWELRTIPGPNTCPDYVTKEGMDYLYDKEHKIQHTANRSAYRIESVPEYFWAREDGGVGGSHPSNIVDHGYAIRGTLNVCGDTPIILIADGPTLGGYVNVMHVINADLWKIGQGTPSRDSFKFIYCTIEQAVEERKKQKALLTEDSIA
jgi:biotin-dependent carboxylase-like uncharacterized protein